MKWGLLTFLIWDALGNSKRLNYTMALQQQQRAVWPQNYKSEYGQTCYIPHSSSLFWCSHQLKPLIILGVAENYIEASSDFYSWYWGHAFSGFFNTYTVWTGLLTLISINSSSHLWWGPANVPMSNACLNRGFPFCYLWWLFQASQLRHWSKPSSALFEMIQSFVCRATLQELVICEILHFPISWTPHHPIVCLVSIVTMN